MNVFPHCRMPIITKGLCPVLFFHLVRVSSIFLFSMLWCVIWQQRYIFPTTFLQYVAFFSTTFWWFVVIFPTTFGCSTAFFGTSLLICYVFTGDEKVAKWRIMSSMIDPSDWSIFALYHYYTDSPHLFKVSRRRFQSLKMILWISHKANSDDLFQTELS